jgi:hypothetical protein
LSFTIVLSSAENSAFTEKEEAVVSREELCDMRVWEHLLRIDQDLAEAARREGCLRCGGRLDGARYPRKPRGCPIELDARYESRLSLCCDACRKRTTPPSVLFLGRRVYYGAAIVLSLMAKALTPERLAKLKQFLGVDRRTVRRWQRWWRESFPRTALWSTERGRLMPPVDESALPASLLLRFSGDLPDRLISLLRFVSPLTTGSAG